MICYCSYVPQTMWRHCVTRIHNVTYDHSGVLRGSSWWRSEEIGLKVQNNCVLVGVFRVPQRKSRTLPPRSPPWSPPLRAVVETAEHSHKKSPKTPAQWPLRKDNTPYVAMCGQIRTLRERCREHSMIPTISHDSSSLDDVPFSLGSLLLVVRLPAISRLCHALNPLLAVGDMKPDLTRENVNFCRIEFCTPASRQPLLQSACAMAETWYCLATLSEKECTVIVHGS